MIDRVNEDLIVKYYYMCIKYIDKWRYKISVFIHFAWLSQIRNNPDNCIFFMLFLN